MALHAKDIQRIADLVGGTSTQSSTPTEVKCNCDCKCRCITESQVKNLLKGLDDKLNVIYTELQKLNSQPKE
ncbi:MAG: hypothetical protein H7836_04740 [Magnetococcus sp. YQC-3]